MKETPIRILLLVLVLCAFTKVEAQIGELSRSTPEAEGIPSATISALFDSLLSQPATDIHSVMILRHDKVVAEMYPEPFKAEYKHTMYSCSKTFVSAAIGIAISENRLRLTDRVASYFGADLPDSISDHLASMTVRDLLTMSSGIEPDWNLRNENTQWIKVLLSRPVAQPGKNFKYDSLCTYLLSALITKVTGMSLLDYLKIKLFAPMNIREVEWEKSPEGYNTGGWGLYIQSESLAKFGLLLQHEGRYKGRQLIPSAWVREMMKKQIDNGSYGYGYQMWCCEYPGAARADGAFGQYIIVVPAQDMTIVITQCTTYDTQKERRLLWRLLMPSVRNQGCKPGRAYRALVRKEKSSQLPLVKGGKHSNLLSAYNHKEIKLAANAYGWQRVSFDFSAGRGVMTLTDGNGIVMNIALGYGQWLTTFTPSRPVYSIYARDRFKDIAGPFGIAGCYGVQKNNVVRVKLYYVNWITVLDMNVTFDGSQVLFCILENNSSEPMRIQGTVNP